MGRKRTWSSGSGGITVPVRPRLAAFCGIERSFPQREDVLDKEFTFFDQDQAALAWAIRSFGASDSTVLVSRLSCKKDELFSLQDSDNLLELNRLAGDIIKKSGLNPNELNDRGWALDWYLRHHRAQTKLIIYSYDASKLYRTVYPSGVEVLFAPMTLWLCVKDRSCIEDMEYHTIRRERV